MDFLCTFAIVIAILSKCAFSAPGYCPTNGQLYTYTAYVLRCDNNRLNPIGCLTPTSKLMFNIGYSQVDGKFEYSCYRTGENSNMLAIKTTACMSDDGTRLVPNSGVEGTHGYFIITCGYNAEGKLLAIKYIGCVDDNGYRFELDEEFVRNGRRYRCNVA